MIAELLRLRFADGDVKRLLESAQTKTQTALAWQYFASVWSQSVDVVIKTDQVRAYLLHRNNVSQTYRKLKCIYRKVTGNCARELREIDDAIWSILHDAFSGRFGISGEVLLDSHLDADDTASLTAGTSTDITVSSLMATLQRQHEETRQFQALQLQLLRQLIPKDQA
ncbi:hypothetical protein PHYSODRAFT_518986 [Phytophthora sojae]|uniref:Uncharacterized protein n=1 Tax=Phytophthora sojae (strain P6497) TaxID=1094619 RepID=G4ZZG3_PHYSP|nr:hypothetical protein PHYSODRAFT_518986 [Phytophthora sojae]EGZ10363.1 hypothetical protein PHYSODRAFT_518986 [Phytophthora sojae]|eukprot:XP_009533108.1 hypothetical protein PHYSODRAFT_518986 [Phytophthora sojae]